MLGLKLKDIVSMSVFIETFYDVLTDHYNKYAAEH